MKIYVYIQTPTYSGIIITFSPIYSKQPSNKVLFIHKFCIILHQNHRVDSLLFFRTPYPCFSWASSDGELAFFLFSSLLFPCIGVVHLALLLGHFDLVSSF